MKTQHWEVTPALNPKNLEYKISLQVGEYLIEAHGPVQHESTDEPLDTKEWGYVIIEDKVIPYRSTTETFTTSRYAIIAPDESIVIELKDAKLFDSCSMGTWAGGTYLRTLAVIKGRPAFRDAYDLKWIPEAESRPEDSDFKDFELPLNAIMGFQKSGVPPCGWKWNAELRVLSRVLE